MQKTTQEKITQEKVTLTPKELKAIREKLGETQQIFARRLGYVSSVTVAFKEAGTRKITLQDEMLLKDHLAALRTNVTAIQK